MFDEGIRNPDEEPGEGEFLAANADTLGALVGVLSTRRLPPERTVAFFNSSR